MHSNTSPSNCSNCPPDSEHSTNDDCNPLEANLDPVLDPTTTQYAKRLLEDAQQGSTVDVLGISHREPSLLLYHPEDNTIYAIPLSGETRRDLSDRDTVRDGVDCKAAAIQVLGSERFAWIHPHVQEHL